MCLIRVSKVVAVPGKGVQLIINSMLQEGERFSSVGCVNVSVWNHFVQVSKGR